jgi:hypothetical protein
MGMHDEMLSCMEWQILPNKHYGAIYRAYGIKGFWQKMIDWLYQAYEARIIKWRKSRWSHSLTGCALTHALSNCCGG